MGGNHDNTATLPGIRTVQESEVLHVQLSELREGNGDILRRIRQETRLLRVRAEDRFYEMQYLRIRRFTGATVENSLSESFTKKVLTRVKAP
jgi:hypothetical protein